MERQPIDFRECLREHEQYNQTLRRLGVQVQELPARDEFADGVFVEDTALVLDEFAVLCLPGAASRMGEIDDTASAVSKFRPVKMIMNPGRLDGGDILVAGKNIFIGVGGRSNQNAIEQVVEFVAPFGYTVQAVETKGCLHLKTAISWLGRDTMLINSKWVDSRNIHISAKKFDFIEVDPSEPFAANVLKIGDQLIVSSTHSRTSARLREKGFALTEVKQSELAKAEAGLTCCSIIFRQDLPALRVF